MFCRCTVPYDNLEPLPKSEKPQWSLPYKHCHQLTSAQQKSALLALTDFGKLFLPVFVHISTCVISLSETLFNVNSLLFNKVASGKSQK